MERLPKDVALINDAARGRFLSAVGIGVSLMRNYDPFKAPRRFRIRALLEKFDKSFGATNRDYGKVGKGRTMADVEKRRSDAWSFLFIAGMWFQDLFNYDFRRTEMCIIPYGTQEGEISFCAYNTGIGWRQIIEKMHMTATLSQWYEDRGRHQIYAGNHEVELESTAHSLTLNPEAVAAAAQTDLDRAGIAKTAREEKLKARRGAVALVVDPPDAAYDQRMERLYREHVLKEKPEEPVIALNSLRSRKKTDAPETTVEA
jgi:hypothetical protein